MVTSGIHLGTPAATSRGFGIAELKKVGELIAETLDGLAKNGEQGNAEVDANQGSRERIDATLPGLLRSQDRLWRQDRRKV